MTPNPPDVLRHVPPHNLEAEQSVLGGLLVAGSRGQNLLDQVQDLTPEDFYYPAHQTIFRAILDVANTGRPTDLVNTATRLQECGQFEQAGGQQAIADLAFSVISPTVGVKHADKVLACSRRRQLAERAVTLFENAQRASVPFEHIQAQVQELASMGGQAVAEAVTVKTGADLLEMSFPDNPLIGGLLDERESLLVCGPSGLGKSVLTLNMAFSLAMPPMNGLWGAFDVPRPLKTAFIQSENTAKATKKRISKIIQANPSWRSALDRFAFPFVNDDLRLAGVLTETTFAAKVERVVEETQSDILILDPLISYHGEDENDNAAMRRSLDALTAICDRLRIACIVVHHIGKTDDTGKATFSGRGASAIGDWCANILSMNPVLDDHKERTNIIEMRHQKSRNFELRPRFYLERTADLLMVPTDDPRDKEGRERVQIVLDCLRDAGGSMESKSALETAVQERTGKGRATIQPWIAEAHNRGKIIFVPGKGRKEGVAIASNAENSAGNTNSKS